jgi:hypothetical protein
MDSAAGRSFMDLKERIREAKKKAAREAKRTERMRRISATRGGGRGPKLIAALQQMQRRERKL